MMYYLFRYKHHKDLILTSKEDPQLSKYEQHPNCILLKKFMANTLEQAKQVQDTYSTMFKANYRPIWDDYFMSMAYLASTRATCDRKKIGAVLVDPPGHGVISTGYNGAPAGMPHCYEAGHELKNIDGKDSCIRTLHAESNAIDSAPPSLLRGSILYSTVIPCYDCAKRIVNAKISHVIYAEYYASRNTELVEEYFKKSETDLTKWEGEFIVPSHIPDDILRRTATIQRSRE